MRREFESYADDDAITVMVWEDNAYGMIAWTQDNEIGRHSDLSFGNPKWMVLAEAFGWNGFQCDDGRKLHATLEEAFEAPGPSLVVIPMDYRENAKLTPRLGEMQMHI